MGSLQKKHQILFEDDHLLIVNKPAHLLSIPDRFDSDKPNLYQILTNKYQKIWVVHRLDKETSGAICFAKTEEAHKHLSFQFENRTVKKIYLALCDGSIHESQGKIDLGIAPHPSQGGKMIGSNKGKTAQTSYQVKETFRAFTLVEAQIHTGRTHQIRVHFQSINHPLAVDGLYNRRKALYLSDFKRKRYHKAKDQEERPLMARASLHALSLSLIHPVTEALLDIEASLPKDFKATLNQLRKWGK